MPTVVPLGEDEVVAEEELEDRVIEEEMKGRGIWKLDGNFQGGGVTSVEEQEAVRRVEVNREEEAGVVREPERRCGGRGARLPQGGGKLVNG